MEIRPLGQLIGAEIVDVDVRALTGETFARIYRAWLGFSLIAARGQALTVEEFLAYSQFVVHYRRRRNTLAP